jgi:hypothetical protein
MCGLVFFFPVFLQGRNSWKKYENDLTGLRSQKLYITQGGDSCPVSVLGNICHHIQRLNNYHITFNKRCTFVAFFPTDKLRCLKFEELFTSLQIVHEVAWKESNIDTFGGEPSSYIIPPPPTFNCESSTPNFQFSHCLTFYQFLPMEDHFTHDTAFKRKTVCQSQVTVQLVENI